MLDMNKEENKKKMSNEKLSLIIISVITFVVGMSFLLFGFEKTVIGTLAFVAAAAIIYFVWGIIFLFLESFRY